MNRSNVSESLNRARNGELNWPRDIAVSQGGVREVRPSESAFTIDVKVEGCRSDVNGGRLPPTLSLGRSFVEGQS